MCGLSTAEVARAFLVSEPTMAARITRAKKKIAVARIPYRVPAADELPERVDAVLSVVHLLFTTGHTTPAGEDLVRRDLVERSVQLGRMLRALLPAGPGRGRAAGAAAAHRRPAGDPHGAGRPAPPARGAGPRRAGTTGAIREGAALVREALRSRPPTRYALQAAIAAVHAESPSWDDTDWTRDRRAVRRPDPALALARRRAQPRGRRRRSPAARPPAWPRSTRWRPSPSSPGYGYLPAARADFLRRLGRPDEARLAYEEALLLTENRVERDFLAGRLRELRRG